MASYGYSDSPLKKWADEINKNKEEALIEKSKAESLSLRDGLLHQWMDEVKQATVRISTGEGPPIIFLTSEEEIVWDDDEDEEYDNEEDEEDEEDEDQDEYNELVDQIYDMPFRMKEAIRTGKKKEISKGIAL